MRPRSLIWLAVATLASSRIAAADDPKFVYAAPDKVDPKAPPPKPVEWTATAEAGLVLITGNAESTAIGGGIHASRKAGLNKLSIDGTAAYVKTGLLALNDKNGNGIVDNTGELTEVDTVTAETLVGKMRYDRYLDEMQSLYAAALGLRDVPAGKEYALGGQVGYSRRLEKDKTSETVAEAGIDYSGEQDIGNPPMHDPPILQIISFRAFIGYKGEMVPGTTLAASLEALTNLNHETLVTMQSGNTFDDTRLNGRIAISTKIGKGLAVETSIESHFDNRPAPLQVKGVMLAPGFVPPAEKLDTIMKFNLIYAFF
jgi:hypothetical protein